MAGQQELNPQILWLSCHQQKRFMPAHTDGEGRTNCVDPFPHFCPSPILSFMAFFGSSSTVASCQFTTLHRHALSRPNPGRLQTKPHLTRIWNADFLWITVRGQTFSLEGCVGSAALWFLYKEQQPNSSLFFPYNSLVPAQTGSGGHCLEKSLPPQLCGLNLKIGYVHTMRFKPA